jgi:ankyrin repeat protein
MRDSALIFEPEITESTKGGMTPLHCVELSNDEEDAKLLLEDNADINAENGNGDIPLHCVTLSDHRAMVDILLDNKAEVKRLNSAGDTPLCSARRFKHIVVAILPNKNFLLFPDHK